MHDRIQYELSGPVIRGPAAAFRRMTREAATRELVVAREDIGDRAATSERDGWRMLECEAHVGTASSSCVPCGFLQRECSLVCAEPEPLPVDGLTHDGDSSSPCLTTPQPDVSRAPCSRGACI